MLARSGQRRQRLVDRRRRRRRWLLPVGGERQVGRSAKRRHQRQRAEHVGPNQRTPRGDPGAEIVADDGVDRTVPQRRDEAERVAHGVERAPRPQIGIESGAPAGGAAIAALVGCDRVKPGLGQRRHDLAPGIGDLGKAVQQQHQRPVRRGIARLENMDVEAIDAADKTGADAGRQRCGFERRREHRFLPVFI